MTTSVERPPLAAPAPVTSDGQGPAAAPVTARRAHRRPPKPALVLLPLVILGLIAWQGYETWRALQPPGPVVASGTIEADEVQVGPEVVARIVAIPVEEGATVRTGDVLARLDDSLLQLQLRQADEATRQQLNLQSERYVLRAPIDGRVARLIGRVGEVASPGQVVATVSDTRRLRLTLYVLERDLGRVQVGQRVDVTADPFGSRVFAGTVSTLNTKAEFTPRNVQTQRDRLNLVFGVKVRVDNPDGALKPGMPVDATLIE